MSEDFLATAENLADTYEALTPENRILLGIGQQLRRIADALTVPNDAYVGHLERSEAAYVAHLDRLESVATGTGERTVEALERLAGTALNEAGVQS